MAVSALLGTAATASTVATTGLLALGATSVYQQNKAQNQAADQFNQSAAMEIDRQATETRLAEENLAQQQAALNAQNAAFAAQQAAAAKAQEDAQKQATLADIANNRAIKKAPNIGAMLTGNENAALGGGASTLLTGAGGAGMGTLGRSSLLGA